MSINSCKGATLLTFKINTYIHLYLYFNKLYLQALLLFIFLPLSFYPYPTNSYFMKHPNFYERVLNSISTRFPKQDEHG